MHRIAYTGGTWGLHSHLYSFTVEQARLKWLLTPSEEIERQSVGGSCR